MNIMYYLLAHSIVLISQLDPLKYLFEKPALIGRLARRLLLLSEFDLQFRPRKTVKGRVVDESLVEFPIKVRKGGDFSFPDKELMEVKSETWLLYFDGVCNQNWYGVGILLIRSDILLSFKMNNNLTNNQAGYEAHKSSECMNH